MEIDGYTFSPRNSKLGDVWNFSLPPGLSCSPDAPCKGNGKCYAMKAYCLYKTARTAWDRNYWQWKDDVSTIGPFLAQNRLCGAVNELCESRRVKYFRIHVAGDFIDHWYYDAWRAAADVTPRTRFLAFTKCTWSPNIIGLPDNMTVRFSEWPGWAPKGDPMAHWAELPKAWVNDPKHPDPRIPRDAFKCRGSCSRCKFCWNNKDRDVVFKKH